MAPLMRRAIRDNEKISTDITLKKRDGTTVIVSVSGSAVRDRDGNPTHLVATMRPVT